jgi:hypothetical protein
MRLLSVFICCDRLKEKIPCSFTNRWSNVTSATYQVSRMLVPQNAIGRHVYHILSRAVSDAITQRLNQRLPNPEIALIACMLDCSRDIKTSVARLNIAEDFVRQSEAPISLFSLHVGARFARRAYGRKIPWVQLKARQGKQGKARKGGGMRRCRYIQAAHFCGQGPVKRWCAIRSEVLAGVGKDQHMSALLGDARFQ